MLTARHRRVEARPHPRPVTPASDPGSFDRDYWIAHCDGFRVDGTEGRIGVVHHTLQDSEGRATLAVLAGRLGRRLLLIQASEVAFIVPRARHIWLRNPTTIIDTQAI